MKTIIFSAIFALLSGLLLHAADRIILKDGTELEGTISEEDADTYTIKIAPEGGGLAVPRIVRKSDIREVKKAGPDEAVFKELQKLVPVPDRLTPQQYEERVGRCEAFLKRYPQSVHAADVKKIKETLEAEMTLAKAGGLKFEGAWIKPADRVKNAYEIDARIELADMMADLEAQRYQLALRHFETLQNEFKSTESYREAVPRAVEALTAYKPIVASQLSRVDEMIKQRAQGLERLSPSQRQLEEAEIARRERAYKRQVNSEQALKTKWLTVNPYEKAPLQVVARNIDSTLKSLEKPPTETEKLASEVHREAWDAALRGDYETGRNLVSELKSLNVPERYLAKLEANLVEPEPENNQTPTEATKPDEPEESAEAETAPEEEKPKKERVRPPTPTPAATPSDQEDEGGFPIQIVLVIVLVLVIVGALVAAFGGRKKH